MRPLKPSQSRAERAARTRRLWLWPLLALAALLVLGGSARPAGASDAPAFRIVVHPSNARHTADKAFLADAFLKKVTRWESGETIRPLDQRPDAPVRRAFSQSILQRSVIAVRSYWQQRIFSGRDVPPPSSTRMRA